MPAIVIGLAGGVVCFFACTSLKSKLGYDDSLDAFGVHGVGGTLGAILTGVFASTPINDAPRRRRQARPARGNPSQIVNQLIATAITWVFAVVGSLVLLKIVDVIVGLRVTEEDEYAGLDLSQHGETGYNFEEVFPGTVIDEEPETAAKAVGAAKTVAAH